MGQMCLDYIDGNNIFICASCAAHLTSYNELISKAFKGRHGKAYLFNSIVNATYGPMEERTLLSGKHIVRDIICKKCSIVLGWKYDKAYDESQKYKEGKFILEKAQLKKQSWTY